MQEEIMKKIKNFISVVLGLKFFINPLRSGCVTVYSLFDRVKINNLWELGVPQQLSYCGAR
jgi:hypothetical protein